MMPRKKITEEPTEEDLKNLGTPEPEDETPEVVEEEEEPQFEQTEEPSEEGEEPKKKGVVPHAAMHEERQRRQHVEKEYGELNEKYIRLSERANLILQQIQERAAQEAAAAQPKPEIPDRETQPFEYMQWL